MQTTDLNNEKMPLPFLKIESMAQAQPLFEIINKRKKLEDGQSAHNLEVENNVRDILCDVQKNGLAAVLEYTRRFDAPDFTESLFQIDHKTVIKAYNAADKQDLLIIEQAAANIREFHLSQKEQSTFLPKPDGTILGRMVKAVTRAGLYIPGGRAGANPLISSLLMTAIPAQVAGVAEIAVVSPPMPDGGISPHILATAHLLGLSELYAVGSAWGIAALAYGAGKLKPVDVIAGPGNIYVATAKKLLMGTVGIDMIAGPSEICIIADATTNPVYAAADMLSQAEHDKLAAAVCLVSHEPTARAICSQLSLQLAGLPRNDIAAHSLFNYGAVVLVTNVELALDLANAIAPEHLELLVDNPWSMLPRVQNAGAVFLGHNSAEPLGDYYAGTNHVLPTMGTARFASALSASTFCKKISVVAASREFALGAADPIAILARLEGLEAHARSALSRKNIL